MTFNPEQYFNKLEIKASDFSLPLPPKPHPIHPNIVNLSNARPNVGFYPIKSISIDLKKSPFELDNDNSTSTSTSTSTSLKIPLIDNEESLKKLDITKGLNYAPWQGFPQLLSHIENFTKFHGVNLDEFKSLITSGSGDSLNKILQGFIDPGDTILVESSTYTPIFAPIEFNKGIMIPIPVEFDPKGEKTHLNPEIIEDLLENWSKGPYKDLKFPKIFFTVPTQNPSGLITSNEIIQKIIKIADKYDLLIIEDDPDGFIRHLPTPLDESSTNKSQYLFSNSKFQEYKRSLHNSLYLSTNSPRVFHLGTFSKTIFPGMRIGYITSNNKFIDRLQEVSSTTTKSPSGFSQLILTNLFNHWNESLSSIIEGYNEDEREGADGFLSWTYQVSIEYTKRFDIVFKHLKNLKSVTRDLISPVKPQGGMFFIIRFNFKLDRGQFEALRYKFIKYGVLIILGNMMSFDKEYSANSDFIRLTLSNVDNSDQIIEGINRLDKSILEYYDFDYKSQAKL
ncbi:Aromatic amino acid aminotransferase 2 [Wickerhamomyces ciferrii]|uniref:Aromatic amino acid aminotransferase 2 n=1 Tax=Wickerhamomyces ciferrii (strain ATCC 14091 / BCRC 22168 / CBS 111 / JCM 3599 / NBRC 0793 / NRRL Y-1031 F-60-10) TaxID=1206466 RepID=K0KIV7_WICCF|nr:Aromatic amino acid aminotransferase 2 [Wickerhamomyces ciferrii]CCH42916.1 Aromatic amino acid aminotransferase 2 [Wickerhamomyces ciferrii]